MLRWGVWTKGWLGSVQGLGCQSTSYTNCALLIRWCKFRLWTTLYLPRLPNHYVKDVNKNNEDVQGNDNYSCGQHLLFHNGKVLKEETTLVGYKVSLPVKFFLVVLSGWCINAGFDVSVKRVYYVLMLVCCSYIWLCSRLLFVLWRSIPSSIPLNSIHFIVEKKKKTILVYGKLKWCMKL